MTRMKTILHYTVLFFLVIVAVSCSKQTNEVAVSGEDNYTTLSILLARCDNDESILANVLNISVKELHAILTEETEVDSVLSERLSSINSYVEDNDPSLLDLRLEFDNTIRWYDRIYYWPKSSPWSFWGVTLLLIIIFIITRIDDIAWAVSNTPFTWFWMLFSRIFFLIKYFLYVEIVIYVLAVILHFVL